jgi:hypothetical protein
LAKLGRHYQYFINFYARKRLGKRFILSCFFSYLHNFSENLAKPGRYAIDTLQATAHAEIGQSRPNAFECASFLCYAVA